MIVLFTDFGPAGPYVGPMRAVLARESPGVPVVELMSDAPSFAPRAAAYLLAALAPDFPPDAVFLAVVDPGVGGPRPPVVAEADGQRFVGPGNGLFEIVLRRAARARLWEIAWRPDKLSSTFHGRDLFAPVAARLATGRTVARAETVPPRHPDWPDDLAEIVYVDAYGNAMTGLRAGTLPGGATINGLARAHTFSSVRPGEAFWYENANGLAEIAVNRGSAAATLGLKVGDPVQIG
jgi:S-adenosylmethionine hydrolase